VADLEALDTRLHHSLIKKVALFVTFFKIQRISNKLKHYIMSVKIQINSVEALERLIGGNTEIEIELRQSVVENFMKKHINAIANSKVSAAVTKDVLAELIVPAKDYRSSESLTAKAKDLLHNTIDYQFKTILNEALDKYLTDTGIDTLIKEKASYIAETLTNARIDERFDRQVDAEIKKRLGLK